MRKTRITVVLLLCIMLVSSLACLGDGGGKIADASGIRCGYMACSYGTVGVVLTPTGNAKANTVYTVELWEGDRLRGTTYVRWNQPQLNVGLDMYVCFPLTQEETRAYGGAYELSHVFNVKIHE